MLKVLELFAGIGACSKALDRLGIEHEIVDAVEIDKYAIASFNAIHGTNFETQDITTWDKDLECDLIMHGSPCQDFSVAGKQAGGDVGSGTRSSLMYETIRIVGKLRPKYVVWENVKNLLSKTHKHNFDAYIETMNILGYNSYYQVLNAKDYGIPQNRERVFTISIRKDILVYDDYNSNIRKDQDTIGTLTTNCGSSTNRNGWKIIENNQYFQFPEKEPLKLRLKDMLEEQVDEKYYLSDTQIERIKTTTYNVGKTRIQEKDYCDTLCARDWKDPKCVRIGNIYGEGTGTGYAGNVYNDNGLSPALSTMSGGNRQPMILEEPQLITHNIQQTVKVRKYPVDIEKLKEQLRNAKLEQDLNNRQMAEILNIPQTQVEHYFRTDNSFAIPSPEIWLKLKNILKIETDEFDESIMTFEEKDGIYEKANRVYDEQGLAPTLTQQEEKIIERTPLKFLNRNQKNIDGDYAFCVDSSNTGGIKETTESSIRIRKLTPKECWRLMGFDDEDFEKAEKVNSNTQLYKQARKLNCSKCIRKNI